MFTDTDFMTVWSHFRDRLVTRLMCEVVSLSDPLYMAGVLMSQLTGDVTL